MHSIVVLANQSRQMKHLVPRSHKFQTHFSLSQKSNRDHGLQRELHTTGGASKGCPRTVMADSQVVNCNRLSYQQVIHILPPLQAPNEYSFLRGKDGNYTARLKSRIPRQATQDKHHQTAWLKSIPSQCTLLDRCVDNSVQDKPVFPSTHVGGLLDMITRVIK